MKLFLASALAAFLIAPAAAEAAPAHACGGAAVAGGAKILCSQTDPKAPAQSCTFFWSLMTVNNTTEVVEGSFLLLPGSSNAVVYQGSGFNNALSNPIIVCQEQ